MHFTRDFFRFKRTVSELSNFEDRKANTIYMSTTRARKIGIKINMSGLNFDKDVDKPFLAVLRARSVGFTM